MVKVYAIDGVIPVVHPSAFVHPSAVLIGVLIGVMVYGATRGGSWFLPVILPLLLIAGLVKGSLGIRNRLTDIGSAIRTKGSDGGS